MGIIMPPKQSNVQTTAEQVYITSLSRRIMAERACMNIGLLLRTIELSRRWVWESEEEK